MHKQLIWRIFAELLRNQETDHFLTREITFSLENVGLMDALQHYTIPIQGLGDGIHNFDFDINDSFFAHFEHSPVQTADLKVQIVLTKKPGYTDIVFNVEGTVLTPCDRCLTDIHLPIKGAYPMLVKDEEELTEDIDVIFINSSQKKIEVAQFIYEFSLLSIPIIKTYDCDDEDPRPCDDDALDKLYSSQDSDSEDTDVANPFKDKLQNFKDN